MQQEERTQGTFSCRIQSTVLPHARQPTCKEPNRRKTEARRPSFAQCGFVDVYAASCNVRLLLSLPLLPPYFELNTSNRNYLRLE